MTGRLLAALLAAAACSWPSPATAADAPAGKPRSAAASPQQPSTATPPRAEPPFRALMFGDFGDPTEQQRAVAAAIVQEHRSRPFDLGFSLGDNVYPCGADPGVAGAETCRFDAGGNAVDPSSRPAEDPRIAGRYEKALQTLASGDRPLPIHVALGNHDVASHLRCREAGLSGTELARRRACLEVAHRSPVWLMPARHYLVDRGPARFVVLDTNLLIGDYGGFSFDDEVAFVRDAVQGAGTRKVFVVGHHPAATAATHRDDFVPAYLERLARIVRAGGSSVVAWFAGHDHHLQHLRTPSGLDVFVSGNGAAARPDERFERVAPDGAERVFASTAPGFASLEVSGSGWRVLFEDSQGHLLHCCEAAWGRRCEAVACPAR